MTGRPATVRPATAGGYGDRPRGERTFGAPRNTSDRPGGGFRREGGRNDRREPGNRPLTTGRPAHTH